MVKRGHRGYGPQASEGEAQHGLFCWTGRIGQGDQRLYCGCWTPRRAASVEFEESEVVAARPTLRASLPLDVFAHVVWSDIGRIDAAHCIDGDAGGTRNLRIVLIADFGVRDDCRHFAVADVADEYAADGARVGFFIGLRIGDEQRAVSGDEQSARAAELFPGVEVVAVLVENLQPVVRSVGDEDAPLRIDVERMGLVELARARSGPAPFF